VFRFVLVNCGDQSLDVGIGRGGGSTRLRGVERRAEVAQHPFGRLLGLCLVDLRLALRRRVLGHLGRRCRLCLDLVE
jgi:hypothetical protein